MEQKTEASQAVKFRKKPVEVEAIQWTGSNLLSIIEYNDGRKPDNRHDFAAMKWDEYAELVKRDGLKIFTLEGKMNADVGDWIIKGVKNEFYPCKPDIFELTYERAALKAQPALISASVPVMYQQRMVAPNGNTSAWYQTPREMHERYSLDGDVGDGFKYEVRALYAGKPAPTEAAHVSANVSAMSVQRLFNSAQGEDIARLECLNMLINSGAKAWPRSCLRCGLGPCQTGTDRARASAETGGVKS